MQKWVAICFFMNKGSVERFQDLKKSKSAAAIPTPGPGEYPMLAKWLGKKEEAKEGE